jgi:hypothetical protein
LFGWISTKICGPCCNKASFTVHCLPLCHWCVERVSGNAKNLELLGTRPVGLARGPH